MASTAQVVHSPPSGEYSIGIEGRIQRAPVALLLRPSNYAYDANADLPSLTDVRGTGCLLTYTADDHMASQRTLTVVREGSQRRYVHGANPYTHANCNPTTNTDPTGACVSSWISWGASVIGTYGTVIYAATLTAVTVGGLAFLGVGVIGLVASSWGLVGLTPGIMRQRPHEPYRRGCL